MAKKIFRGPGDRQPKTISLPVAGAYFPGSFVTSDGSEFTQATTGEARVLLLNNQEYKDQSVTTAYTSGDTADAFRLEPEMEFQARAAAATYVHGDPLTINASGILAAAAAGDLVVAYYDGAGETLAATALVDVVWANNAFIMPASA